MAFVLKGVLLGVLIFMVDLIMYTYYLSAIADPQERKQVLNKIRFTLPIGLFMQIFFALIFVFTFRFLAVFKALNPSISGGLYFSYIMFLPMMYMLFNNWLWGGAKRESTYLNIFVWGVKLAMCGLFTPLI